MNKLKIIFPFLLLSNISFGLINEEAAWQEFQSLADTEEQNFTNLENLETDIEKKTAFNNTLSNVLGTLAAIPWNHPTGNWPIIDWNKVGELDGFFEDQFAWIIQNEVIANTDEKLARLQFAGSIIAQQASLGSEWFELWFLAKASGPDDNIKMLLFWYSEDFGIDLKPDANGGNRLVDWPLWKQKFNMANDLGKAVLLKNLTVLASKTDGWEDISEIHMLVLNGNNDALKAIALVKGHKNLGNIVIEKWRSIAETSTNTKLKNLALEVINREGIETELPD